jgi:thiol-disulfide isomerase/thioredoxin
VDVAWDLLYAEASHEEDCPDIGPICSVRAEPPQIHHTRMWISELRLLAEYGVLDWLAVQLIFPVRLIDTWTRYTNLAGTPVTLDYVNIHHRDEVLFGAGDPQLLGHVATRLGPFSTSARIGVSVPLGVVHQNPYRLAAMGLPHEHIQFGTGTFDPVLGVDAALPVGRATLSAFAQTQVPLYAGSQGYQAGTRLFGGLTVAAPFADTDVTLRATALAVNEWAERWDGQVPTEDGNQGRADVYLGAGLTIPFAEDWSVSMDLRGRAWGYAKNAQLDLPLVLEVSVGRLFHFESNPTETASAPNAGDVLDAVTQGEAARLDAVPGKWTVFDFWAPWCEACKVLDPQLRQLAAERPDVALRRINIVDLESPIARRELTPATVLPHVRVSGPDGVTVLELSGTPDTVLREIKRRSTAR